MMQRLLGCEVSAEQFARWAKLLVREPAPYFFSEGLQLPAEALILSRKAFSAAGFDLAFVDSYTTYAISSEAQWVAMLTSVQLDALPVETRQRLLAEQVRHKRGQVYGWEWVEKFLQDYTQIESCCVTFEDKHYLALDSKIWALLTPESRQQWLSDFIQADTPTECLSSEYAAECKNRVVRRLAGTFADTSGPNCFSTTLAAVTQDESTAQTIADFWLHQEPFFQGLERRGYTLRTDLSVSTPGLHDAVLIWQDAQGTAQHACYLIENGLVLNKNSQAWFAPRQLLQLQTVLDVWKDDGYEIAVYSQ